MLMRWGMFACRRCLGRESKLPDTLDFLAFLAAAL